MYLENSDDELYKELYYRYKDKIFTYIKRFLYYSSDDIISDLVDEVFIKVYLKLPQLKTPSYFKNWLYRIAHNRCVDYVKVKNVELLDKDDILNETIDHRIDIEQDYLENEKIEIMLNIIDDFDNDVRSLIILKFFQGLTFSEISKVLKVPTRTLQYRLRKALDYLEKKLKKEGL